MQIHIALCISAEKYLYHVAEQKVHKHVELFLTNANHTSHFAFQMNQYSVLCDRASRNVELGKKYIFFLYIPCICYISFSQTTQTTSWPDLQIA